MSGIDDDAGADRAPEHDRIVDRVIEQQRDAVLGPHAQAAQRGGKADAACLQLAIGERAVGIDERDLVAETARHIGVDEIGHGVVGRRSLRLRPARCPRFRSALEQPLEQPPRQHAGDAAAVMAGRERRLHRHDLVAHQIVEALEDALVERAAAQLARCRRAAPGADWCR